MVEEFAALQEVPSTRWRAGDDVWDLREHRVLGPCYLQIYWAINDIVIHMEIPEWV